MGKQNNGKGWNHSAMLTRLPSHHWQYYTEREKGWSVWISQPSGSSFNLFPIKGRVAAGRVLRVAGLHCWTGLMTNQVCQVAAFSRTEERREERRERSHQTSKIPSGGGEKEGRGEGLIDYCAGLAWECLSSRPHDNIGNSEDQSSHKFVGKGACS